MGNFVLSRLLLVTICEGGSHVSWRTRFCMKYDFRTFLCWYSRRKQNQTIKTLCEDVAVNSVVFVMLDIWGFRVCQLWCSLTNDFFPEQFSIYLRIVTRNKQSVWQMFDFWLRPVAHNILIMSISCLHSFANIINYIYSKFHNDLACIRAVMDQNVKQCSDFAVYFYQIRWFDITAFAFKAPKVQEVVEITASGPPPFVCKYYQLYIQQIS